MNYYAWLLVISAAVAFYSYMAMWSASSHYNSEAFLQKVKNSDESMNKINKDYNRGRNFGKKSALFMALYILLVGFMLTAIIYINNMNITNTVLSKCIGAGVHIIFFYIANGLAIKYLAKKIFVRVPAKRKLEYMLTFGLLFFALMCIHAYWELSLWALALLAGKIIWFDSFFAGKNKEDGEMLFFMKRMIFGAVVFDFAILFIRVFRRI